MNYQKLASSVNITALMGEGAEHNTGGIYNVTQTFIDCFYYLYQLCDILINGVPGTNSKILCNVRKEPNRDMILTFYLALDLTSAPS